MDRRRLIAVAISLTLAVCRLDAAPPWQAAEKAFSQTVDDVRQAIVVNPVAGLSQAEALRQQIQKQAPEPDRAKRLATVDWLRSEALIRTNRAPEAMKVVEAALKRLPPKDQSTKLGGDLVMAHGGAAQIVGDIQKALADYQQAFRIFGKAGDARGQAIALQDIGIIYRDAGDFENALRYNAESAETYAGDPAILLSAYNNRGNALIELGRSQAAEAEYRRALSAARALNSPMLETRVLQNLARAQTNSRDYEAAQRTLNQAYAVAASGPASSWRPALDGVGALVALRRGQLDEAARLIERTFATLPESAATMPLSDFHRTAYEIFRMRGETGKALAHLEAYRLLDDKKKQLAASTNAALMSARFDFANQNAKILKRDKTIAVGEAAQARLRGTILIGLLVAAGIILLLLLIGFVSLRRSRDQVRAANATLSSTNVALEKALAAKTEFLATTSHEIRTPLNGILGMTQVILADKALNPTMRGKIELVHGAGETMRALVDDILDVAKMETGELVIHPEEMDLIRLLGDAGQVWAGQAETKGIILAIEIGDAPGRIVADEVRLRQIVFNLMSNAIKFTDRGHVRLTAFVGSDKESERLIIRVEDSGVGIPAAQLDTIFESFKQVDGGTTRRYGGTGLGLAICRNLAEAMGGTVRVESTVGLGSTFTLDLPLVRGVGSGTDRDDERPEIERLADAELLLVEANPLSQGILRAVLGGAVRSLHIVGDLETASAALKRDRVDHVVADGAVVGLDVAKAGELAEATHAVGARLTLLWPAPDDATRAALAAAGADQVVAKPIAAPDLLAALQSGYIAQQNSRDIAA